LLGRIKGMSKTRVVS